MHCSWELPVYASSGREGPAQYESTISEWQHTLHPLYKISIDSRQYSLRWMTLLTGTT